MLSVVNGGITVTEVESVKILGDADGSEDVDIIDSTTIQRFLAEIRINYIDKIAADVDGDEDITIVDSTFIQRWLAEMRVSYGIGEPIV